MDWKSSFTSQYVDFVGIDYDTDLAFIRRTKYHPPINMSENQDSFYVCVLIPGIELKDIEISMFENRLELKGEIKNKQGKYLVQERMNGTFHRTLQFSHCIDKENIQAEMENGVLFLLLPKEKSERISIVPKDIHLDKKQEILHEN